ncbi:MAG: rod shape-determining protein MreD [Candidatus Omnitrophica bacterium]|nr:rod shape-determining protein MreD [Candidatus Omnitrophota bacterium]
MRVIFVVVGCSLLFFVEFSIYNLFDNEFVPNLLLIFIVFMNLYAGVRFSILAALVAGMLRDSYSIDLFGMHTLAFIGCAYLTTIIKKYIYRKGSVSSRILLVGIMLSINFFLLLIFHLMVLEVSPVRLMTKVFLPQLAVTLILTNIVLELLRSCAIKLSA